MVNKVILVGNLGSDPELKYTQGGTAVANFNLATSRKWKGKDGQMNEETEWSKIVVWGPTAEFCGKYLTKGNRIYLEGRLQTRKWQDQQGNDRYTTEVVADTVQNLTPRESGGRESGGYGGGAGVDVPVLPTASRPKDG